MKSKLNRVVEKEYKNRYGDCTTFGLAAGGGEIRKGVKGTLILGWLLCGSSK